MSRRKYDYIKVADRQRIQREAAGKDQNCDDCGTLTKDLYWAKVKASPLTMPLCPKCYEDFVRRMTRETVEVA